MRTNRGRKEFSQKIFGTFLIVFSTVFCLQPPTASAAKGTLATITGAVQDNKGNPVAGAVISLLKDGANKVIKQTRSDAAGRFSTRILPGRYGIRAIAQGFNEVVFASVDVRASQELIYRFNLEPIGSGRTLPEQRKDREDVKWVLRSAQTRRSIFQAQEGEDRDIQAVLGSETASDESSAADSSTEATSETPTRATQRRMQGVVETYFASNPYGGSYPGLNFAISTTPSDRIEFIVVGQTGIGPNAPRRFEANTRIRAGQRHRVGMSLGALASAHRSGQTQKSAARIGWASFSVRAIDE